MKSKGPFKASNLIYCTLFAGLRSRFLFPFWENCRRRHFRHMRSLMWVNGLASVPVRENKPTAGGFSFNLTTLETREQFSPPTPRTTGVNINACTREVFGKIRVNFLILWVKINSCHFLKWSSVPNCCLRSRTVGYSSGSVFYSA